MSGFTDLLGTIAKFSPLIASILPIPGAAIIGQVVASVFGGDINKPDELNAIIQKDPNAGVKIAEIQAKLQIELEKLAVQHAELVQQARKNELDAQTAQLESDRLDRENARELAKGSNMPAIVTVIIISGFMLVIWAIMFRPITNQGQDAQVLFLLFGTLSSAFASCVAYWLGSSAGSKQKDVALTQAATASASAATSSAVSAATTARDIADLKSNTSTIIIPKPFDPTNGKRD